MPKYKKAKIAARDRVAGGVSHSSRAYESAQTSVIGPPRGSDGPRNPKPVPTPRTVDPSVRRNREISESADDRYYRSPATSVAPKANRKLPTLEVTVQVAAGHALSKSVQDIVKHLRNPDVAKVYAVLADPASLKRVQSLLTAAVAQKQTTKDRVTIVELGCVPKLSEVLTPPAIVVPDAGPTLIVPMPPAVDPAPEPESEPVPEPVVEAAAADPEDDDGDFDEDDEL